MDITKPDQQNQQVAEQNDEKQGAKCCGCCCDMKRAVIIVNILDIVFSVIALLLFMEEKKKVDAYNEFYVTIEGREYANRVKQMYLTYIIFIVLSILAAGTGIWGASKYNINAVMVPTVWVVLQFIIGIILYIVFGLIDIAQIIIDVIVTGLVLYPHVGFIYEVKKGIMKPENYPHPEEYSCCCV